ncbi:MAG TPA: hypothetical protein VH113_08530 [Gemmatimonadales bacterium]|jgi:hypothetical protein|nr:hypothetical protein [Gemmatimonadales bacterium]
MGLDLRLPIGALFLIVGLLLAGYGWMTAGMEIDRWWGLVMVVFGLIMVTLARRSRRSQV